MPITVADLAKLSQRLDVIELLAKWTPATVDDAIVRILKLAAQDQDILAGLAAFLNWLPIFQGREGDIIQPKPELPGCLEPERDAIEDWRLYLRMEASA